MKLKTYYFKLKYENNVTEMGVKAKNKEEAKEMAEQWAEGKEVDLEIIS